MTSVDVPAEPLTAAPDGDKTGVPNSVAMLSRPVLNNKRKRTVEEKEADMVLLAEMVFKRRTDPEIRDHINRVRPYKISRKQVELDRKALIRKGAVVYAGPLRERKAEELQRLEMIEREAALAWEKSKLDGVAQTISGFTKADGSEGKGGMKSKSARTRDGDPKFLDVMLRCHERRCRILGLETAIKMDVDVSGEIAHGVNINTLRAAFRNRVLSEGQVVQIPTDVRVVPAEPALLSDGEQVEPDMEEVDTPP